MFFSLIAPTFGRPEEVTEFLESLTHQNASNFEVIIADGTPDDSLRPELKQFENNGKYELTIIYEQYLPVSDARNRGAEVAKGDYIIFLDSDCIIPENYLNEITSFLEKNKVDAFGGPDAAHKSFTDLQKAISYSMTSLFTTGGIRGKEKHLGEYHPRGFNMGISAEAFKAVGGYDTNFRCGEDVELSMRIIEAGFKTALIPKAHVYHKRRTTLKKFYKQVFRFGAARINLARKHKGQLKLTHFFPYFFTKMLFFWLLFAFIYLPIFYLISIGYLLYFAAILIDSTIQNNSLKVGMLSIATSVTQLVGYGIGFGRNWFAVYIMGNKKGIKL